MRRRSFLKQMALSGSAACLSLPARLSAATDSQSATGDPTSASEAALRKDWLNRWERNMEADVRNRYCDKEMGEELGWLVSPFLNGFYYGYRATRDNQWLERLIDWTDSCLKRAVKEPDGFLGWPKGDGGGGESKEYSSDSLLGEAMALRPIVLLADKVNSGQSLKA